MTETERRTVGVVSPGAMGSAVGRSFAQGGARCVATVAGRGPRTRALAAASGLELLADLDSVVAVSDVVVSVVSPAAAEPAARAIAAAASRTGARPIVVDANALSPATCASIAVALTGLDFLDASISGPPPSGGSTPTRLYLAGPSADAVAALPAPGLDLRILSDIPGPASALKMCTAALYKGRALLLAQCLLAADRLGVADHVVRDIGAEIGGTADLGRDLLMMASKTPRYIAEMREIAATQDDAGLGAALFEAFADLCARLAASDAAARSPEDAASSSPSWSTVLQSLRHDAG